MLHGTKDMTVPYVNGKAVYDRAQKVGLSSTLITIEGAGHVPMKEIMEDEYFTKFTTSLYDEVTKGAQAPAGCQALESIFLQ